MGRMSRSKGSRGELELSKELARLFRLECERTAQRCGKNTADVRFIDGKGEPIPLPLHFEAKRCEALSIYKAMAQAAEDASEHEKPVVCHRRNNEEWLFVARLQDMPEIATTLFNLLHSNP